MITRRGFVGGAAAVAFAAAGPEFSWETVPVYTHLGKTEGDFTPDEIRAIARFPEVTIEKQQARGAGRSCEEGIYVAARQIKAVNPATRVLFYFNAVIDWPNYEARAEFERHPRWALRDRKGEITLFRERMMFDVSLPEVREWWSDVCAKAMKSAPLDGVFMDAIPKIAMVEKQNRQIYGDAKFEALESGVRQLMQITKDKIGRNRTLLFNGLRGDRARWADGGMRYLDYADAAMIEHFAAISALEKSGEVKKEWLAADMEMLGEAARKGKSVYVKAWPRFANSFPDQSKWPATPEDRGAKAAGQIEFPLACFLAAAAEGSRFLYTWGYRHQDGGLLWLPEYSKRLGKPKGAAVRDGWRFTREFAHAKVHADLEQAKGQIEWA